MNLSKELGLWVQPLDKSHSDANSTSVTDLTVYPRTLELKFVYLTLEIVQRCRESSLGSLLHFRRKGPLRTWLASMLTPTVIVV